MQGKLITMYFSVLGPRVHSSGGDVYKNVNTGEDLVSQVLFCMTYSDFDLATVSGEFIF